VEGLSQGCKISLQAAVQQRAYDSGTGSEEKEIKGPYGNKTQIFIGVPQRRQMCRLTELVEAFKDVSCSTEVSSTYIHVRVISKTNVKNLSGSSDDGGGGVVRMCGQCVCVK
jgi:hypothetical protein